MVICHERNDDLRQIPTSNEPIIYFVTPTYPRREQMPELTRLGQTLMHIKNLHWIVADDQEICNPILTNLLKKTGKRFRGENY